MKDYYIEFSRVEKNSPRMVATKVSIGSEILSDPNRELAIDLCDHPLYPKLEQYVHANPSGKLPSK